MVVLSSNRKDTARHDQPVTKRHTNGLTVCSAEEYYGLKVLKAVITLARERESRRRGARENLWKILGRGRFSEVDS